MKAVKQTTENGGDGTRRRWRRKINPASPPTTVELRGVRIHFPFKPYKCQEDYMGKVLDALLKSENGLLESPTGTGKTLCLLCSTLAWQRQQFLLLKQAAEIQESTGAAAGGSLLPTQDGPNQAARVPVIIYASRTHSQLSQVVRELRNTRYRPKHAVLGSREQMCVNPKVKKANSCASDINHGCNKLAKERKCPFRNNLEGFVAPPSESFERHDIQPVMDMEDLVAMGKENKICPFYHTRSQVENAELILVPYNYLFDKEARKTTLKDVPWNNAVVIFDEAHNLESFASDSASFDLSNQDLAACVSEVQKAIGLVKALGTSDAENVKMNNLLSLKKAFLRLETYILEINNQGAYSGEFMMEIFKQGCGLTHSNYELFIEEIKKVNDLIFEFQGGGKGSSSARGTPKLEHFVGCLKRVFGHSLESRCLAKAACYRVHITPKQPGNADAARTVSYWCFAPALAMEELANLKVRSILVTSGTLSPLPSYAMELGLEFPHTLENPHIIDEKQICVRVIGKGVTGKLLSSSFERRKDSEYYTELGITLVSLAKVVPMGMLVFFPSYSVMEACVERWGGPTSSRSYNKNAGSNFFAARRKQKSSSKYSFPCAPSSYFDTKSPSTAWSRLLSTKSIVLEPRSTTDLADAMAEFHRLLALPKSSGVILMGVCRGKFAEGIDFSNDMSRAVVITGLPFPPSHDPKVKLKREFLDSNRRTDSLKASTDGGFGRSTSSVSTVSQKLSGHDWYSQQAHRAVNQAIGRVIRNRSDYGAVLLLDARYGQKNNQEGLSCWVRPHVRQDDNFGNSARSLASFFKVAKENAKAMAEADAKLKAETVSLQYEKDDSPLEALDSNSFTRVALIRRPAETSQNEGPDGGDARSSAADSAGTAYVAPDQVIARLDVAQSLQSNRPDVLPPSIDDKNASMPRQGFDAVFGSKYDTAGANSKSEAPPAVASNSKKNAARFMEKVQAGLSAAEQSKIRKAVVAMQRYADKKEVRPYLEEAKGIVDLVLRCEPFAANDIDKDSSMLYLFFRLLPPKYLKHVEILAFKVFFERSKLCELCKNSVGAEACKRVRTSIAPLLQSAWCAPSQTDELTSKAYMVKARESIALLRSSDKLLSPAGQAAFCKLVPSRFAGATRTLFDELRSSKRGKGKKNEVGRSGRGDESLRKAPPKKEDADSDSVQNTARPVGTLPAKRVKSEQQFNPYAKKPALSLKAAVQSQSMPPPRATQPKAPPLASQPKPEQPSLSSYLKKVESDTFVKQTPGDIATNIKANAPKNIACPICNEGPIQKPFIAECGHMACLQCWLDWLKRSETCPTCRLVTKRDSLARAVFEKQSGSSTTATSKNSSSFVPTLSQLCENGGDDDTDDELEIV